MTELEKALEQFKQGDVLAQKLKVFADFINIEPEAKKGALQEEWLRMSAGLVKANSLPEQGAGEIFLSVWSMGTATMHEDEKMQVPLTIRLTYGEKINGAGSENLNIEYIDVAQFDVQTGELNPLIYQPHNRASMPVDLLMVINPN